MSTAVLTLVWWPPDPDEPLGIDRARELVAALRPIVGPVVDDAEINLRTEVLSPQEIERDAAPVNYLARTRRAAEMQSLCLGTVSHAQGGNLAYNSNQLMRDGTVTRRRNAGEPSSQLSILVTSPRLPVDSARMAVDNDGIRTLEALEVLTMNRRKFLLLTGAVASVTGALRPLTALMQPSDSEAQLFADSEGVAFRQYSAQANPENPAVVDDGAEVTILIDFYAVLFATPEVARSTFDEWSEWIENSGDEFFGDPTRENFPIGEYDTHEYGLVSQNRNVHGGFDGTAVWNLKGEGGNPYLGHLAMNQTGTLISIQWLHTDNPEPTYPNRIGNEVNDAIYANQSANAPQWIEQVTEDFMLAQLPVPEAFVFEDGPIAQGETVTIDQEWVVISP